MNHLFLKHFQNYHLFKNYMYMKKDKTKKYKPEMGQFIRPWLSLLQFEIYM